VCRATWGRASPASTSTRRGYPRRPAWPARTSDSYRDRQRGGSPPGRLAAGGKGPDCLLEPPDLGIVRLGLGANVKEANEGVAAAGIDGSLGRLGDVVEGEDGINLLAEHSGGHLWQRRREIRPPRGGIILQLMDRSIRIVWSDENRQSRPRVGRRSCWLSRPDGDLAFVNSVRRSSEPVCTVENGRAAILDRACWSGHPSMPGRPRRWIGSHRPLSIPGRPAQKRIDERMILVSRTTPWQGLTRKVIGSSSSRACSACRPNTF
jgi:hypothetical protein